MAIFTQTTTLFALTRAVQFGSCLLLAGVFVFDRLIVGRASPGNDLVRQRWTGIARALVLVSLPAALISGVAWLVFVAMDLNEASCCAAMHSQLISPVLNETQFGGLWKFRAVALVATAIFALAGSGRRRRPSALQDASAWLALLGGAVFAASLARAGHGADGTRWHQAADAVHLLVGVAWPIGLVPLALLLWRLRGEWGLEKWAALAPLVNRFSVMSFSCVVVFTASGIINAWPLVGSISNLVSTAYGRTLLVKIALFAVMALLGAANMLYLRPRLALDFRASTPAIRQRALSRLQINVWLEVILGAGVLLAVGLLGTLMPACDKCCCAVTP